MDSPSEKDSWAGVMAAQHDANLSRAEQRVSYNLEAQNQEEGTVPLWQFKPVQPGAQAHVPSPGWQEPSFSQLHRIWQSCPNQPGGHTAKGKPIQMSQDGPVLMNLLLMSGEGGWRNITALSLGEGEGGGACEQRELPYSEPDLGSEPTDEPGNMTPVLRE